MAELRKPGVWSAVREIWDGFSNDNGMTWAAALAFYAGLSLAPLLTITAWIASATMGDDAVETVERALTQLLGEQPGRELGSILRRQPGQEPAIRSAAGLVSVGILVFSATGVFAQLQTSLDHIWGVKARPTAGWINWVRKRFLSFGLLMALLFLLLVSMIATATIQGFISAAGVGRTGWMWQLVSALISLAVFIPLFAAIFKYLPDVKIRWGDVFLGATITAVLFLVGQFVLGFYLGRASYESSYGAAAGSFLSLLVWVYYSAVIFFIGAETTQVYAQRQGHPVEPDRYAQPLYPQARPA